MTSVDLGAAYLKEGRCRFRVWAPHAREVSIRILSPSERSVRMDEEERGYHFAEAEGIEPGSLYLFRLKDDVERPDPASRLQPQGVHGPSQVVDPCFSWTDGTWKGLPLEDYIFYELHVGTFTPKGTFEGVISRLDYLKELGVTAVELMPVAQFPGVRNWGYDGVFPFAVQQSYGGTEGLRKLVDACHERGLAVVLDVVYNHLGPEGNYLGDYGPYFTDRYRTPWGRAVNFDGPSSDEVRRFFIQNALYWIADFHVDALRVDAVHAVKDFSARPFLMELAEAVEKLEVQLHRKVHLIAESDLNDARILRPREAGGFAFDAQWNDDFHHSLHVLLTGESDGYYRDFKGTSDLGKAFQEGFVYSGEYSAFRKRRHGNSSADLPASRFVVFMQNHDQVGNRMRGERLSTMISMEQLKLGAAAVILSPNLPLLFMGEEYGEATPFPYFVHHSDPDLVEAVRKGRREEFRAFDSLGEPPDPQDASTFASAVLNHARSVEGNHEMLLDYYKELIRLRKSFGPLALLSKDGMEVWELEDEKTLAILRGNDSEEVFLLFHFKDSEQSAELPVPEGNWEKRLDSADTKWNGPGNGIPDRITSPGRLLLDLPPRSVVLLHRHKDH